MKKANELTMEYNGGNPLTGTTAGSGNAISKKFKIPNGAKELTVKYGTDEDNEITVQLAGANSSNENHDSTSPVDLTVIEDDDALDRAIWAAIKIEAYWFHQGNSKSVKTEQMKKVLVRFIDAERLKNIYGDNYGNWKDKNPFVKDIDFTKLYPAPKYSELNAGIGDLAGSFDVTNYVQAFADFLRDRIKQELTIAYLQKFKQTLDENKEIRELLPKTWSTFKDNNIFNLPSMGATYKDAFADDLANLTDNFFYYIKRNHFEGMPDANKDAFTIGSSMYAFINQMANGDHPSTALHTVALQNPYNSSAKLKSTYIIALTDMLSQNLMGKTGDKWIELKTVSKLNPDIIRIFFALLYDKYPQLFDSKEFSNSLLDLAKNDKLQQRFNDIYNFVVLAQNIDNKISDFQKLKANPGAISLADQKQTALDFFLSNSELLTGLIKSTFSIVNPDEVNKEQYTMMLSSLKDAIDIAKAIRSNSLPKATNAAISLITTVVGSEKNIKWLTPLKNILAFANDMVAAKSSDEIKAVIENYAAPVQSYQVIRKSNFSVALSAYPGLYVGTERNRQTNTKLFKYGTFGVTAPIGFAFSFGSSAKDSWSKTLYLSVLDIGSALSYRFNNTTTDIPDKIKLAQIFSPGAHFIWGIKKSPLAIKVGYQYAPELRDITTQTVTVNEAGVWRLSAGLSVDIPVFIFTSKH
ncbi:hypothetical protein SNE26_07125 [Mucilaginibacter sp. cycad4]|uniref:hypothetical protein n=1 Tax=Mucilaginibacter sp. cycad4 TaxID=3342096 RepID=UPI002AAA8C65|nr:hypothetical protein [Mucilaginibacter gossypii]WPV01543.1 hypothetical protein SNE26_07125 [Mucilaginibacter gossypii]